MHEWIVSAGEAGMRLDVFLTSVRAERTRSSIKNDILKGRISVNGKAAAVHRFLKTGDVVALHEARSATLAVPLSAPVTKVPQPELLDEAPAYLVINKPAGLLVHPDAQEAQPTLIDWLVAHDAAIGRVGEDPLCPGIVHRLDREVSGLMVVAKTPAAYESLQKQFAGRTVTKTYLALVYGALPYDEGDIKFRIAHSSSQARMAARPAHETTGKAAWTHYRVLERMSGATLVELQILSGRTHQIRAHLHALGNSIMGDPLYTLRRKGRSLHAPRVMLQSVGLEFNDPTTGERKIYKLEPDPSFPHLLKQLRTKKA